MSDDKDELRRLWNARKDQERRAAREIAEEHVAEQRAQAQRDAKMDRAFENDIASMFGASVDEVQAALSRDDDADTREVMAEYDRRKRRGDKRGMKKVLKKNRAVVKKSVAKNKRSNCLTVLALLVGTAVTLVGVAVWGVTEAFAAIVK